MCLVWAHTESYQYVVAWEYLSLYTCSWDLKTKWLSPALGQVWLLCHPKPRRALHLMATYQDIESSEAVTFLVNLETPWKWRLLESQQLLSVELTALTLCKLRSSSYEGIFFLKCGSKCSFIGLIYNLSFCLLSRRNLFSW